MIPTCSFVPSPSRSLWSLGARVPPLLRHLWLAILLHGLAGICHAPLQEAVLRWPAAAVLALLLTLVLWVVPRARPRVLVRVGEALVAAGAAVAVAFAIAACGLSLAAA